MNDFGGEVQYRGKITARRGVSYEEYPDVEGLELELETWGDYPLDSLLIRADSRSVYEVIRRIDQGFYVMDPEFQRDFIWTVDKQSRLIESVAMRIPLPVFYMAEDDEGRMVVVDGLQRLTTFHRFLNGELRLKLPDRKDLHNKCFDQLSSKIKNRIEDFNLIYYSIDSRVPERARLDIFERVNGGVPLTRQQMRNCLFMGPATQFIKHESKSDVFLKATGESLNWKTMRDREFVNRFCAFHLLGVDQYKGDMDDFLALALRKMNEMTSDCLDNLSVNFRRGLANNFLLFKEHSFRRHFAKQGRRSVLNASLWDVMSTGLSRYDEILVEGRAAVLRDAIFSLLENEDFTASITKSTNDSRNVRARFDMANQLFREVLDDKPG